jgi:hypothetical protein
MLEDAEVDILAFYACPPDQSRNPPLRTALRR